MHIYTFMYMFVCICIHTHTHTHIYIHTHTYIEGHGNPLHYPCLENRMDRGWWATIYRVTKLDTTEAT